MTRLDDIQALFFRAIQWPQGVEDFLRESDEATRATFASVFGESETFRRNERVDVYANAYFHRLLGALEEMLPKLAFLCEPIGFHNLVTDYVLACPSESPDLRRFGDRLPKLLQQHSLGQECPLLVEVAQVELALSDALDASDANWLTQQSLQAVPVEDWPSLQFSLAPASRLLSLHCDWNAIVEACEQQDRQGALSVQWVDQPRFWLVSRAGHSVSARQLDKAEGLALKGFADGLAFGPTCETVEREVVGFGPADMLNFLGRWLSGQVLVRPETR